MPASLTLDIGLTSDATVDLQREATMPTMDVSYSEGELNFTFSVTDPDRQRTLEYVIAFLRGLPAPTLPPPAPKEEPEE